MSSNCQTSVTKLRHCLVNLIRVKHPDEILVESFPARPASLRIAIVTETFPPEVNGVAMTLGRIVDGLLRRGHSVQMVRPRQGQETPMPSRNGLDEVLAKGVPIPAYGDLRFGLPSQARLVKLWQAQRPDIVHVATEGPLGWSAVSTARKLRLPVTSSFHTNFQSYSMHYGMGLLKSPIDSYLRKLHNRTLATLVPTKALAQDLQRRGYANVQLMSRGVAIEQFSPAKRSPSLRASWGVATDDLVVLLVGRLAKEKNIGLLIAAFRAILVHCPTAKLVFVGDGPMRRQLEESVPQALFAGIRQGEDLARHYASADLFLFPSLTETFGNVVPEALASGLALTAFASAAAVELVRPGHNGLLVAPGDDMAFVSASLELATKADLRATLRTAAPASVAHLHWDSIHDTFIDTLRGVLERERRNTAAAARPTPAIMVNQSSA